MREYKCCMTCWRTGKCNTPHTTCNLHLQFATCHNRTSFSSQLAFLLLSPLPRVVVGGLYKYGYLHGESFATVIAVYCHALTVHAGLLASLSFWRFTCGDNIFERNITNDATTLTASTGINQATT